MSKSVETKSVLRILRLRFALVSMATGKILAQPRGQQKARREMTRKKNSTQRARSTQSSRRRAEDAKCVETWRLRSFGSDKSRALRTTASFSRLLKSPNRRRGSDENKTRQIPPDRTRD